MARIKGDAAFKRVKAATKKIKGFGDCNADKQDELLEELRLLAEKMKAAGMNWTANEVLKVFHVSGAGNR